MALPVTEVTALAATLISFDAIPQFGFAHHVYTEDTGQSQNLFAIGVGFVLCGWMRVRLKAHVGVCGRPLIGRAMRARGRGVWCVSFGSNL